MDQVCVYARMCVWLGIQECGGVLRVCGRGCDMSRCEWCVCECVGCTGILLGVGCDEHMDG